MFQKSRVAMIVAVVFILTDKVVNSQINPNGWIQTDGWNYMLPLKNNSGCTGGGKENMERNWFFPHDIGTEDPIAPEGWDDIDFTQAANDGYPINFLANNPIWISNGVWKLILFPDPPQTNNWVFFLYPLGSCDSRRNGGGIYNFLNTCLPPLAGIPPCENTGNCILTEDAMTAATTYVQNITGDFLNVEIVAYSHNSIQIWVNDSRILTKSSCNDFDAEYIYIPAVLKPDINKIAVLSWYGKGIVWGFLLGIRHSGELLSDNNPLVRFLGTRAKLSVVTCPSGVQGVPITLKRGNGEIIEKDVPTPFTRIYNSDEIVFVEAPEYFGIWKFRKWCYGNLTMFHEDCDKLLNCRWLDPFIRTAGMNLDVSYRIVAIYEPRSPNQPPSITHAPVTTVEKGKEILFSFDVTDDRDDIESIVIWVRFAGTQEYIPNPVGVHNGIPHYDVGLSGLTDTLASMEYYIQATDREGLSGFHGTPENPHVICITDPQQKTPVIIIPGIMGSELLDAKSGDLIWLDPRKLLVEDDPWLLNLLLDEDGDNPDLRFRCAAGTDAGYAGICQIDCGVFCVPGGKQLRVGNILNIEGAFTSYRELVLYLENYGYTLDKDLFLFSYDWRLDFEDISNALRLVIEPLTQNCEDKVNIIAHSMGGIVARSYIQQNVNNHRVDTLIFLGTPHRGTPSAHAILEGYKPLLGVFRDTWPQDLNWWLELDTQTLISQNFPAIYQLLPRYDYVKKGNQLEEYTISNEALRNNNGQLLDRAIKFFEIIERPYPEDIKYYSILGTALPTLNGFVFQGSVCKGVSIDFWADGTVPNNSSTWFGQDKKFFVKESHNALPGNSAVKEKILSILDGNPNLVVDGVYPEPQKYENEKLILKKLKKITSCSPISLRIFDIEEKMVGVDNGGIIREEILNSEYFKFDENETGYFPEGEYTIEIIGEGSGKFTLILETLEDNDIVAEVAKYENIPVVEQSMGKIMVSEDDPSPLLHYDVDGDNVDDFILSPGEDIPEELKNLFAERGDFNRDNSIDLSDAVSILGYLFSGLKAGCLEAGKVNLDSKIDLSDAIYLLGYLFLGTQKKPQGLVLCK